MHYFLYSFIFIITTFFSFKLFQLAIGSMDIRKLTPISFMIYFYIFLMSFAGVFLMNMGITVHPDLRNIVDKEVYLWSFVFMIYLMIFMPLSMNIVNIILNFNAKVEFNNYLKQKVKPVVTQKDTLIFYIMVFMSVVSFFISFYLYLNKAPIFQVLSAKYDNINSLRLNYSRNFSGSKIIKDIVGELFVPFSAFITFVYSYIKKQKKWIFLFIILFLNSFMIKGAILSKSAISWYISYFLFFLIIIKGSIKLKTLIGFVIIILSSLIFMYYIYGFNLTTLDFETLFLKGGPIGRTIFGQVVGLPNAINIFPDTVDFLKGADSGLLRFIGFKNINAARIIMKYVNPIYFKRGVVGVMNSIFITEAYANFGILGVLFSVPIVGIIIQFIYILFIRLEKTPINISWGLFTLIMLSNGITGGFFSEYLFNTSIIAVFIFWISIYISLFFSSKDNFVKIKFYNRKKLNIKSKD